MTDGATQTWDVDLEDQGCRSCPFVVTIHPGHDLSKHAELCLLRVHSWTEENPSAECCRLPMPPANDGPLPAPEWCPLREGEVLVRAEPEKETR